MEGISDYYALRIAGESSKEKFDISLVPGAGSGASGPIISQMLGQGMTFALLLDDDKEGRKAAENYRQTWFLSERVVVNLGSIFPEYQNKALEKILGEETTDLMRDKLAISSIPSKKQIGWYLAEACASGDKSAIPELALGRLRKILKHFDGEFRKK